MPVAPDLQAVVEAFRAPTGTLTEQTATSALMGVIDLGERLRRMAVEAQMEPVMQSMQSASGEETARTDRASEAQPPGLRAQAFGVDGEGWLQVTRICGGWEAEPRPDPANGSLRVQVGFTEEGLDPVIWGRVQRCHYVAPVGDERHRIEIDGGEDGQALRIYLGGGPVAFSKLGEVQFLISLRARVAVDDEGVDLSADFRVDPENGSIEFLVPLPDGPAVASLVDKETFSLRAANGTFSCVVSQRVCSLPDGSKVSF